MAERTVDDVKGLPIKVKTSGVDDRREEDRITNNNFYEGLRQSREDDGKEINKRRRELGLEERDFSESYPTDPEFQTGLPKGASIRNRAKAKIRENRRGYAKGGMVRGCGKAIKGHGKVKVY